MKFEIEMSLFSLKDFDNSIVFTNYILFTLFHTLHYDVRKMGLGRNKGYVPIVLISNEMFLISKHGQ